MFDICPSPACCLPMTRPVTNHVQEEIVGGSVVVGDTQGSTGSGKAEGKETEKDRLSRRLKEFSNARKAGGGGGSNSHR